jgi:hypothetical protein
MKCKRGKVFCEGELSRSSADGGDYGSNLLAGAFAVKATELFKSFDELKTGSAPLLQ